VDQYLADVYGFPLWSEVLEQLGLPEPEPTVAPDDLQTVRQGWSGGEGESHRTLKNYVAQHPELLGLPSDTVVVSIEHMLPSGDVVDVVFETPDLLLAVEVKGRHSPDSDLLRGLFQCVKYRAVAKAEAAVTGLDHEVQAVLVLETLLPSGLRSTRNTLGIHVIEGVQPGNSD